VTADNNAKAVLLSSDFLSVDEPISRRSTIADENHFPPRSFSASIFESRILVSTAVPARQPGRITRSCSSPVKTYASCVAVCSQLIEEKNMKRRLGLPVALVLVATLPVLAQRGQEHGQERGQDRPRANQGHVPQPPERRDNPHARPEPERHVTGHVNTTPHVNKDHWYGHDRPDDKRYHVEHAFEHGRFEHFGPSYRYRVERFAPDHRRFWLP